MTKVYARLPRLLALCALAACAPRPAPAPLSPAEALVQVKNESAVPLRIRLCGEPCSGFVTAGPMQSVELRFDSSRLNRFVVTAMDGDRMVAQEAFVADARVLSLVVQPPRIERLPYRGASVPR